MTVEVRHHAAVHSARDDAPECWTVSWPGCTGHATVHTATEAARAAVALRAHAERVLDALDALERLADELPPGEPL